jgi:hypothetical protein
MAETKATQEYKLTFDRDELIEMVDAISHKVNQLDTQAGKAMLEAGKVSYQQRARHLRGALVKMRAALR